MNLSVAASAVLSTDSRGLEDARFTGPGMTTMTITTFTTLMAGTG